MPSSNLSRAFTIHGVAARRYIIAWGSNVPQTRTPDAHFFVEARYNGTKVVAITPDYSEVARLSDLWLHPKPSRGPTRRSPW